MLSNVWNKEMGQPPEHKWGDGVEAPTDELSFENADGTFADYQKLGLEAEFVGSVLDVTNPDGSTVSQDLGSITSAANVSITDVGGHYTGTEVETALQETGLATETNATDISNLKDGTDSFTELSLSTGRTAFKELTSGTLSTSGWYTIAEVDDVTNFQACVADFMCSFGNSSLGAHIGFRSDTALLTPNDTAITLIPGSYRPASVNVVDSFRLCIGATSGAGGKVQAKIATTITSLTLTSCIGNNTSMESIKGFTLVTPYLDDTPTLPDGVTTATFIEAGAEFKTDSALTILTPRIAWRKGNDDIVRLIFQWDETPKQGTHLTLSFITLILRDLSGVAVSFNGTETLGAITVTGREVVVQATRSSAWSTLTGGGMVETLGLVATIS